MSDAGASMQDTVGRYDALLEAFFGGDVKRTLGGGERRIGFDCSVSREQGRTLYRLVRERRPARTLEIGLAWGGSAVHILAALEANGEGLHVAIDPYARTMWDGIAVTEIERLGLAALFTLLDQRSDVAMPPMIAAGERFDFIFIDGDHRYDGIMVDLHNAHRLASVGAIIAFDDAGSAPYQLLHRFILSNLGHLRFLGFSDDRFALWEKTGEDARSAGFHVDF